MLNAGYNLLTLFYNQQMVGDLHLEKLNTGSLLPHNNLIMLIMLFPPIYIG